MSTTVKETTLAQVRVHWGVFSLPILAVVAVLATTLPMVMMFQSMQRTLGQYGQRGGGSGGLLVLLMLAPELLVGVPLLGVTWAAYLKSNVTLTDRRLVFRTGLLTRVTGELPLENIEAIIIAEPLLGRVLGYGTVTVTSVGGLSFPLQYIAAPQNFHALLQQTVAMVKAPAKPGRRTSSLPPDDDSRYMPKA